MILLAQNDDYIAARAKLATSCNFLTHAPKNTTQFPAECTVDMLSNDTEITHFGEGDFRLPGNWFVEITGEFSLKTDMDTIGGTIAHCVMSRLHPRGYRRVFVSFFFLKLKRLTSSSLLTPFFGTLHFLFSLYWVAI